MCRIAALFTRGDRLCCTSFHCKCSCEYRDYWMGIVHGSSIDIDAKASKCSTVHVTIVTMC